MQLALVAKAVSRGARRNTGRTSLDAYRRHVRATTGALQGNTLAGTEAAAYDALESKTKVFGKERINHGINCRVAIAQPEEHRKQ